MTSHLAQKLETREVDGREPGAPFSGSHVRAFGLKALPLALSYGVSRVSAFTLVVFIGRSLGTAALGEFSVAHALGQYVMLGSDLGVKVIGARTIAAEPARASGVLPLALRKMLTLVVLAITVMSGYALLGPVPSEWRWFLLAFVLSSAPYAINIDWIFWGLESFRVFSLWQGGVYAIYAGLAIAFTLAVTRHSLYGVALANAIAWTCGALFLWWHWQARLRPRSARLIGSGAPPERAFTSEIRWRSILALGSTGLAAMFLDNIALLVLGALATSQEAGEYGAAAKVLAPLLGLGMLLWYAAYPWLARRRPLARGCHREAWLAPIAGLILGCAVALPLALFANSIVGICFGAGYAPAAEVLRVLSAVLPFSFAAVMGRAVLIAHAHDALSSTGSIAGAVAGLGLSLPWVSHHGALGAAWATTTAYATSALVSLAALAILDFGPWGD